VRQSARLAALQ
jgi:hypothetical protein